MSKWPMTSAWLNGLTIAAAVVAARISLGRIYDPEEVRDWAIARFCDDDA